MCLWLFGVHFGCTSNLKEHSQFGFDANICKSILWCAWFGCSRLLPVKNGSPETSECCCSAHVVPVLLRPTCIGRIPGPQSCTFEADPGWILDHLLNPCSEESTWCLPDLESLWVAQVFCTYVPLPSKLAASRMASSQGMVAMPTFPIGVLPKPLPAIGCSHPRPRNLVKLRC